MKIDPEDDSNKLFDFLIEKAKQDKDLQSFSESSGFIKFIRHMFRDFANEKDDVNIYNEKFAKLKFIWNSGQDITNNHLKVDIQSNHEAGLSTIAIHAKDRQFLVESITEELQKHSFNLAFYINSVIEVKRDKQGKLVNLLQGQKESWIYIELSPALNQKDASKLKEELLEIIQDVNYVVDDFNKIKGRIEKSIISFKQYAPKSISQKDFDETLAFLEWILAGHFTFLGMRRLNIRYRDDNIAVEKQDNNDLGILRDGSKKILKVAKNKFGYVNPAIENFYLSNEMLLIAKANTKSRVRRQVYMDYIGIKIFDKDGKAIAEERVVGLFTYETYRYSILNVPILRQKSQRILEKSQFHIGGHNYRSLMNAIENYPRDEFFQSTVPELFYAMMTIFNLMKKPGVKVIYRRDRFNRYASIVTFVPRDSFNTSIREQIAKYFVDKLQGRLSAYYVTMSETTLSRVHYIIGLDETSPEIDLSKLDSDIEEITKNWNDKLEQEIFTHHKKNWNISLYKKYKNAFSLAYQERLNINEAILDIENIETMLKSNNKNHIRVARSLVHDNSLEITLYAVDDYIKLSEFVPVFENMHLFVTREINYEVSLSENETIRSVWIHDFFVDYKEHGDVVETFSIIENAILAILKNECPNDNFNALIVVCGFTWQQVTILRGIGAFTVQEGLGFSISYIAEVLYRNYKLLHYLVELFETKFDLSKDLDNSKRSQQALGLYNKLLTALENVKLADEDLIIRNFADLIMACVRTNYYQQSEDNPLPVGLAFKFNPALIPLLPRPKPYREIFVTSSLVDGTHLRLGPIARGGLRWSDRKEDYRTEVLGLVKAQNVKNSLIVAEGAKGCFYPKNLHSLANREEFNKAGLKAYKMFVASLLSVSDNYLDGKSVSPQNMICYDGDDEYLVVAADKGTAKFSDIANQIADQYNFWLGDAFASGGSAGYDHKKMGITARGAWVAMQRHFREKGKNIQTTKFSVAGIGDMSGDIFGNGMLLSEFIELKAAFDHRHIFIDPTPNIEKSYKERQRMFEIPVSNWDMYDKSILSQGGGVYSRALKRISLSPEANDFLALENVSHTPNEIIKAILASQVEMLWFGGIGTYIKATGESDHLVGDKANNHSRVEAGDIKAQVIGEGANLGLTQKARIELALMRVAINTDAVDNSAGVDSSDHEVNIKILLKEVILSGKLAQKDRNQLLEDMTQEVATHVLKHNYTQTRAISIAKNNATYDTDVYIRLMDDMQKNGDLDRKLEFLPTSAALTQRTLSGDFLTRPELAVLFAYVKNILIRKLTKEKLLDDELLFGECIAYFPSKLHQYKDEMRKHRLRKEIIATRLVGDIVETMGVGFVFRMQHNYHMSLPLIFKYYYIAKNVVDLDRLIKLTDECDYKIDSKSQIEVYKLVTSLITEKIIYFSNAKKSSIPNVFSCDNDKSMQEIIDQIKPQINKLQKYLNDEFLTQNSDHINLISQWENVDLPKEVMQEIKSVLLLKNVLDIAQISKSSKLPINEVFLAFYKISQSLFFYQIQDCYDQATLISILEKRVKFQLFDKFKSMRAHIVFLILQQKTATTTSIQDFLDSWLVENKVILEQYFEQLINLEVEVDFEVAKMHLVNDAIENLQSQLLLR